MLVPIKLRSEDKLKNGDNAILNCVRLWRDRTQSGNLFQKIEQIIVKNFDPGDTLVVGILRNNDLFLRE